MDGEVQNPDTAIVLSSHAYRGLSQTYEKTGQFSKSLDYYKLYTTLKDSMFNEEKSKDLGKLEAKHEMDMAEVERKKHEEELRKPILTRPINRTLKEGYFNIVLISYCYLIDAEFVG